MPFIYMRYFVQKIVFKNIFHEGHSESLSQFLSLFIASSDLLKKKHIWVFSCFCFSEHIITFVISSIKCSPLLHIGCGKRFHLLISQQNNKKLKRKSEIFFFGPMKAKFTLPSPHYISISFINEWNIVEWNMERGNKVPKYSLNLGEKFSGTFYHLS